MTIDQQFVEFVIKSLVSKPEAVHIERRIDEKGVLLELSVDPEDLGRVIGKRGATAQSVRTLLRALGTKNEARYNLKIVDNGPGPSRQSDDSSTSSSDDSFSRDDSSAKVDDVVADEPVSTPNASHSDDDDIFGDDEGQKPEKSSPDSFAKTRQELEELDDLDV
jgi:predicted RNA-binding protein YlqC (UPF0109 family)